MNLHELCKTADYVGKNGMLFNKDCIELMDTMLSNEREITLTLTDIPYDSVNRKSNGLRNLDKENADIMTFDLHKFLEDVYEVTNGTIIIFCGINQISEIYNFFADKQKHSKGTVRHLVWKKTNPSPMNGEYIYLSGIEDAIWFKKRGATFNARCKNTVFEYPCGRSKLHPTEKNHKLLQDLILDPCSGSGSHCLVAMENGRKYVGCELNKEYFNIARERIEHAENEIYG
jgi:DNA modification methylase